MPPVRNQNFATWFARGAVGLVFAINLSCALAFITFPENYAAGFELSGVPGVVVVRAFGTYPPVIHQPGRQLTLFQVILAQQVIGLAGESWMLFELPPGHLALQQTGLRFIFFDGLGLLLMAAAYVVLRRTR